MKRRSVTTGHFDSEQQTKKIHVSELKIGMFISKLDRDWLDTPFLLQGFRVERMEDIETVCEFCEHVWIDALEDVWVPPEERAVLDAHKRKQTYINKTSAQDEHRQAIGVYREARSITKTLLDEVRLGGVIDTEQAKDTVNDCVQSVIRNPDALMWMARMRNEDEYTSEHCLNVCILAIAFGRHLGLDEEALHKLGMCGLLHDVGKMKIPPEVLNKPGELTDKELKMMRAHTIHGRNLLMASPGTYKGVVDVAYGHHERMDGKGYPRKIKAKGTSDFSRIIAIVDAYDAMTADRCYAPAIPTTEAVKIIYKDKGTHFDEFYAKEFIKCVGLYPPGSVVELVCGKVGIVLESNKRYRHLPKVIVLTDANKTLVKEKIINLSDIEQDKLDRQYLIKTVLRDGSHGIRVQDYRDKGLMFRH